MSSSFELDRVTVSFGGGGETFDALSEVSLKIAPGEVLGIVGPSGAGKTTLLRLLAAAQTPTQGKVLVDGQDPATLSRRQLRAMRSRVGMVYQDARLVPNLRVAGNVLAGRLGQWSLLGSMRHMVLPPREEVRQVHALLERVGIGDKLYQRSDSLSGGQRQRVAIARALFQEPAALLADEPVASVDPARARDLMRLLSELSSEAGLTLCVSLHDLELAREMMPRLVGLRDGRVSFDRPTQELSSADFETLYELETRDD